MRFILDSEVEKVTAVSACQGMASCSLEEAVMGVMMFEDGVMAQFHDAFTIKHAGTGIQIHGTEGSLIAENVMTQQPVGDIFLKRSGDTTKIELPPPENLYERSVRHFNNAVRGKGLPSATGEDGVRSLAVGLAVQQACREGRQVQVRYK